MKMHRKNLIFVELLHDRRHNVYIAYITYHGVVRSIFYPISSVFSDNIIAKYLLHTLIIVTHSHISPFLDAARRL